MLMNSYFSDVRCEGTACKTCYVPETENPTENPTEIPTENPTEKPAKNRDESTTEKLVTETITEITETNEDFTWGHP